jgi:thiol:disulfide interchange protein
MRASWTLLVLLAASALAQTSPPRPEGDPVYDPKADAAADFKKALHQAAREGKNVLMDVGGEWCSWCHRMDKFFVDNPPLLEERRKSYVFLKVDFSDEHKNETFLDQFPKIEGYPHLFVFDSKGKLLVSQETGDLEAGKSYDLDKFMAFLKKWAPAK